MNRDYHGGSGSDFLRPSGFGLRISRVVCLLTLAAAALTVAASPDAPGPGVSSTPRDFFNAGTQKLREGSLREAETLLESVLASPRERLQPPALYNLGHVRFGQGAEELKKSPLAAPTIARGRAAEQQAGEAIGEADEALAGNDVQKLVAAYVRGRGVRKELKAAIEAVRRALGAHGAALAKWRRSSG